MQRVGELGADVQDQSRGCEVSHELAGFAKDFEAKILQVVREKRASTNEILAIQPVPLGVSTSLDEERAVYMEILEIRQRDTRS